ncbi:zinc-dependent alcohol dehydrogenase family protein [Blastococcus saxobsidens]|nr:zinc-dependent alcohol dehydrogenase family protein [Blastococcus saxobsidens]
MRQVVQRRTGRPAEVVEVVEVPVPTPGPDELLVQLDAAPVNPAELLMFEGRYGYGPSRPSLPRLAGIEGVGTVVGGATDRVAEGTPLALLGIPGLWSDYVVIPARRALVLPEDIDRQQASMGLVNPQAVLLLLEDHVGLEPGDVVVQNAANSAFGRVLDAIARRRGLTLVNVVRSQAAADALAGVAHGAVAIDGPDLPERFLELTGGRPARLAVDAVGGGSTNRLAHCLATGGVVSLYGLLSGRPAVLDLDLVVFHGVRLEGYWTPRSMSRRRPEEIRTLFQESLELLRSEAFHVPVEATYGLDDVAAALEHAAQEGRRGKVLLTR